MKLVTNFGGSFAGASRWNLKAGMGSCVECGALAWRNPMKNFNYNQIPIHEDRIDGIFHPEHVNAIARNNKETATIIQMRGSQQTSGARKKRFGNHASVRDACAARLIAKVI